MVLLIDGWALADVWKSIKFSPSFITDLFLIVITFYGTGKIWASLKFVHRTIKYIFIDDLTQDHRNPRDDREMDDSISNGWMPVLESHKLTNGSVQKVHANGQDIVLIRGSNDQVHAIDPYCPHNGAHLGFGEVVIIRGEDCIKCPFHEWSFRAEDGICVDVPYAKDRKAPKGSSVKIHHCREINGFIFIWLHSKGIEPNWLPESEKNIQSGRFKCIGRSEFILRCNIAAMIENSSDFSHLDHLHDKRSPTSQRLARFLGLKQNIIHNERHNPSWQSDKHKANFSLDYKTYFFGFKVGEVDVIATQCGPFYTTLSQRVKIFGKTFEQAGSIGYHSFGSKGVRIIVQSFTDQDFLSKLIGRAILHGLTYTINQDCLIWRNMKRLDKPLHLRNEKAMAEFRRWFRQFYDEKEIKPA